MTKITTTDLYFPNLHSTNKPRFLYHYTTLDAFLKIIETGTLKLCSLSNMNDPYEFLNRNHGICGNGNPTDEELSHQLTMNAQAHNERTNCVRLASLAIDNDDGKPLHKGWFLLNMWTLYGRNHTGVCIVLDYHKVIEMFTDYCNAHNINFYHGKITYTSEFDVNEDMFWKPIESFTDDVHRSHLFIKPDSYAAEQEYRLLIVDKTLSSPSIPAFIPINKAISGVITGYHFPYSNKFTDTIIASCNQLGYNMNWFYFKQSLEDQWDLLGNYQHDLELYKSIQ